MLNPLMSNMSIETLPTAYFTTLLISIVVEVGLIYSASKLCNVFARPASYVLIGWIVIYQMSSLFYGGNLVSGLPNSVFFFAVLNITPILLGLWLLISSKHFKVCGSKAEHDVPHVEYINGLQPIAILSGIAVSIVAFWTYQIPLQCTAGWALFFDPEKVLIARELAGKLSNTPFTSRLIGVYVAVIVPLLIFLCASWILTYIRDLKVKNVAISFFLFFLIVTSFGFLLLTGIKGAILPTMIACMAGALSMPIKWSRKIISIITTAFLGVGIIMIFQATIVANKDDVEPYGFGYCARIFDSCADAALLVSSATKREGSLGLKYNQLISLNSELKHSCGYGAVLDKNGEKRADKNVALSFGSIYEGLFSRAFKVPLQVAAWHYLWVAESGSPGWRGIPIFSRMAGNHNTSEQVYQAYGRVYSGGDETSTSTAPSSFLFVYAAYLGWAGLLFSVLLVVIFDYIACLFLMKAKAPLVFGFSGIMAVVSYNFISSDFFTVLGSHGGLAILFIIFLFIFIQSRTGFKSP